MMQISVCVHKKFLVPESDTYRKLKFLIAVDQILNERMLQKESNRNGCQIFTA